MTDQAEIKRRKQFIKAAKMVRAVWPGYALPRPAPECETDRYAQEYLRTSLEGLKATWAACRAGKGTSEQFDQAVELWWVQRLRAAGIFGEEI